MSSDLYKKVVKANRRLQTMYRFFGGDDTSLDMVNQDINLITKEGLQIGVPQYRIRGLSDRQKELIERSVDSYLASPYSTVEATKNLVNEAFASYVDGLNLDNDDIIRLSRIFRSPSWHKIRELFKPDSDDIVDELLLTNGKPLSKSNYEEVMAEYLRKDKRNVHNLHDDFVSFLRKKGL